MTKKINHALWIPDTPQNTQMGLFKTQMKHSLSVNLMIMQLFTNGLLTITRFIGNRSGSLAI
jgi:hypothetical protein